jgi:hypothetical protein
MANEAYLYDTTDMANWLVTRYGPAVAGYWNEQLSIAQAFTNYSSLAVPGTSVVKVPLVPYTTAVTKTSGTVLVYGDPTDVGVGTINLTTQKALAYLVEDIVQLSTSVDVFNSFVTMAGTSLANALDAACAAAVKGQTTNTAITTGTDNTVTYQNLLTAQTNFNGQRIKLRNCVMGIAPGAFELSIIDWGDKWMSASYRNAAEAGFWYSGIEGKILGMQVFVDPNWTSGTTDECATIWNPQAVGMATHGVRIVGPTPEPLYVGQGFTVHAVFGASTFLGAGVQQIVND